MHNETAPLPSIANDLATLASRTRKAARLLSRAAEESDEGRNDAREDFIRKAREALRAILADENFAPTPEPRDPRVALAVELARAGRSDEEIEAALNEYDAAEVSQ